MSAGSPHACSFCVAKNKSKGPLPFESSKKRLIVVERFVGVANIKDMGKLSGYIIDKLFHKQGANIGIPLLFCQLITLTLILPQ